jgi:hypothetical protein
MTVVLLGRVRLFISLLIVIVLIVMVPLGHALGICSSTEIVRDTRIVREAVCLLLLLHSDGRNYYSR